MRFLFAIIISVLLFSSCSNTKPLFQSENFVTPTDPAFIQFSKVVEPVIEPGDKITMSIWGHEELSIGSVNSSFSSNVATGKWLVINEVGEANLPKLGRVKIGGLSINEANYFLQKEYEKTLQNPVVNIKILNHFVTILGEVNAPGKYPIDNEKMTLIELIGLSSGLSAYAKNDQIEVIREIDGEMVKLQINLRDLAGLAEKNIILQPEDVVYVAPARTKESDNNLQKASIVASILTGAAVIFSVFAK